MYVVMVSGKFELHTYYTFLQRILTSTQMKKFNIFCIINVAMSNIHFSGLDNDKITLPNTYVLKFPSKLLLGKDMFTLTFVDLKNETSISIWEFEKMNVLK